MQGLVHITHQMHQVLQGFEPLGIIGMGRKDGGLVGNRRHHAAPTRTVPLRRVVATGPREIDVVPHPGRGAAVFVGPGGDGLQRLAGFQGQ